MSGNVPLLQAFEEKEQAMEEEKVRLPEPDFASVPAARKNCYMIRRNGDARMFSICNILSAAIVSGKPEMLDYCISNYECKIDICLDSMGSTINYQGEIEALGQLIAGAGEELTCHMIQHYPELIRLVQPEQVIKAGNAPLLRHLIREHPEQLSWYATLFCRMRDLRTPYESVPGYPRDLSTDTVLYRIFAEWDSPEFTRGNLLEQMKTELLRERNREIDRKEPEEQGFQNKRDVYLLFGRSYFLDLTRDWIKIPSPWKRQHELVQLYEELSGEMTPELQQLVEENSDDFFENIIEKITKKL